MIDSILLIDDDTIANYHHEILIRNLGIAREIVVKTNGKEAKDFIEFRYSEGKSLPSLILLDLHMPVLDGIEFIKEIKSSELLGVKNIPVVILSSAFASGDLPEDLKNYGYCFMHKPLTKSKLLEMIQASLPLKLATPSGE